ncbi:MAG: hypothetical protein AB7U49_14145 [Hyphomicrobiaceae bacterium]
MTPPEGAISPADAFLQGAASGTLDAAANENAGAFQMRVAGPGGL